MNVKTIPLLICTFFYISNCFAQKVIEKKNRLNDNVTEKFQVLNNNSPVKNGLYQAFYKRKTPIATGNYTQGKKTGLWRFYDPKSTLMQIYNYDKDSLEYEAREYKGTSDLWYIIDKEIADSDKVTKPIKAGGRYYGYLRYLGLYKIPFSSYDYDISDCVAVIELLISPLGRLAAYKVHSVCNVLEYDQTVIMDVNLFKDEDKKFIPATYNGEPVLSRILIKCRVNRSGELDFL